MSETEKTLHSTSQSETPMGFQAGGGASLRTPTPSHTSTSHSTVAELTGSSLLIDQSLTPGEKAWHIVWIQGGGTLNSIEQELDTAERDGTASNSHQVAISSHSLERRSAYKPIVGGFLMAVTAAQLQTALGDGNFNVPRVILSYGTSGTEQHWLIFGGSVYPGRNKFCQTTASDNAATQATAILNDLKAGPA